MATYNMKFFPLIKAFSLSPYPVSEKRNADSDSETFEWVFDNGDIICFDWDGEAETAFLVFNTAGDHRHTRNLPFQVLDQNGNWVDAKNDVVNDKVIIGRHTLRKNKSIKIIKETDYSEWSFDFNCEVDGKLETVDPEIKVRRNG